MINKRLVILVILYLTLILIMLFLICIFYIYKLSLLSMGNYCPSEWSGYHCKWTFDSDCSVNTCKWNGNTWTTFDLCAQNCCAPSYNRYLYVTWCDIDKLKLGLGLGIGLGVPIFAIIGIIVAYALRSHVSNVLLIFLIVFFWPIVLIGYVLKNCFSAC